jgi:ribonuclease Z
MTDNGYGPTPSSGYDVSQDHGNPMRIALAILLTSVTALAQRASDVTMLSDGKLHVILCGTGSPLPDPERAGSCTAVVAGGQLILIDTGPGSWRKAMVSAIPGQALSAVLLTHFHSDHIGDLGEAMTMSWTNGRVGPLDVYGPVGVEQVVRGFADSYELDGRYRILHHGESIVPAKAHAMIAHTVEIPEAGERRRVFVKNGLSVYAFRVDHRPIEPAYGYRIEYGGRSVVVSGDTSYSENLVRHAAGADLLLHDAMLKNFITMAAAGLEAQGQIRAAKMLRDIVNYHASAADAAKVAATARVETLVLTHLVPVPGAAGGEKAFLQGAGGIFTGKVVVARDGMRFDLEPKGQ